MVLKTYNIGAVAKWYFDGFFVGSMLLCLIALCGLISEAGVLSVWAGILFVGTTAILSMSKRFQKSPFGIILCFFTFIYLHIPTAFMFVKGINYSFGEGLAFIPFFQEEYQHNLPLGFLFLTVCWFSLWLGIVTFPTKTARFTKDNFIAVRLRSIIIIGFVVFLFTWFDNNQLATVRLAGGEKVNSFLAFIFFDHAFMIMAGMILFHKLNASPSGIYSKKIKRIIVLLLIGYIGICFLAGSKAAILIGFITLLFYPFCLLRPYEHAQGAFPTPRYLLLFFLLMIPLFYFALIHRMNLSLGVTPSVSTLFVSIADFDVHTFYDLLDQIFYRLSQGGIDRFMLIFQSFVMNNADIEYAKEFVTYLLANTLNMLLPGTPFPEYYAPSSQLFPKVLERLPLSDYIDSASFLKAMNTQPYTLFGVFMVILGLLAPIGIYLFALSSVYLYARSKNLFLKIAMLYFFIGSLSSYGIEIVVGNSVHLVVSMFLMYYMLKMIPNMNQLFYCNIKKYR